MKWLGFEPQALRVGRHRIRTARYETRSHLPIAAAALVAHGMREQLAHLLRCDIGLRLCEPCVPTADAWPILVRGAQMCRVRGSHTEAALFVRGIDARALVAATFGGDVQCGDDPSPIETRVIHRLLDALACTLSPIVGARFVSEQCISRGDEHYAAYFEIIIETQFEARIGIAISQDPPPAVQAALDAGALDGVPLELVARASCGERTAAMLSELCPGDVLPIADPTIWLQAQGVILGCGESGVLGGKYAVICTAGPEARERVGTAWQST